MATMNVNTTLVTVTVTRVHGYRRGLATAAVRLRYKTTTRPALAAQSSVRGTKVPAADQITR